VFSEIPVLDLGLWALAPDRFATELLAASHKVGFLLLTGHGVGDEFLNQYFGTLRSFFDLPTAVKEQIDKLNSRHFRGWERVGAELTDNRVDYREQIDLSSEYEPYPADVDPIFLRLDGPNQWLDDTTLPGFRSVVEEFISTMGSIADTLMAALSRGFGLADGFLANVFGERPHSLVKLISYPRTPPDQCGVNPHHDAGFITLLVQHEVGGLQALNPAGVWIDVPVIPGTIVVNLGEMLQEISGNYVVATTHRVITSEPRYSSAYFHGPDLRTPLHPLPLDSSFAEAVAASPRHANAGFMAKREELLAGRNGIASSGAGIYGQQLWNYYARSYPANMARHHSNPTPAR
jgi:isopenicillin N synthase-like dioxygenase